MSSETDTDDTRALGRTLDAALAKNVLDVL
jgi:hypothetical protein